GNVPIQQCLTRLLQQQRESLICYVDIDSFKPFNEMNGSVLYKQMRDEPETANQMIHLVAGLIQQSYDLVPKKQKI
ncbi:hypothetical protein, partial [Pseudomonas umsongensis]|uniref:hypothetical protein n=1 Tax=Pseudomonas umsongensis TaxID=198618 RepID=UPI0024A6B1B4